MPTVVGVQFKPVTKIYHFKPDEFLSLMSGDHVVVDTAKGKEIAQVVEPPHIIDESQVVGEIKSVVRQATAWDMVQKDQWNHKEQEALAICRRKVHEYELDIKIVRCEYNFNGGRLMIYFAADTRIDFRVLVREYARIFRTRIEMRQIGVRDEAKLLDGVGKCGRQLCCTSWLREFTPVSIRMAKSQQLPLNPDEISGVCGRLLCCLSYEDTVYREQNKKMPRLGSEVVTPQGGGRVRHIHPLKESVTVLLESGAFAEFAVGELINSKNDDPSSKACGGCTVKRRAGAEEENAKVMSAKAKRAKLKNRNQGSEEQADQGSSKQEDSKGKALGEEPPRDESSKRRRRRRRPRTTRR